MKEKALPCILSRHSWTYLHGRFLIIPVMSFSATRRSFSPPVPHPVCEQYQQGQMNYLVIFPFFFVENRKQYGMSEKTIIIVVAKFIKTMLLHYTSNMVLMEFLNSFCYQSNEILCSNPLALLCQIISYFRQVLKSPSLAKMNYVFFVKLASTCPSS